MSAPAARWSVVWRTTRQAWQGSAGRALLAALLLAVVAVTAVNLLGARIGALMRDSAQDLLGADLVLVAPEPLPAEWSRHARELGLQVVTQRQFPSMVFGAEQGQLAEIKAVGEGHPLRGEIQLGAQREGGSVRRVRDRPAEGTVWVAADLARALGLDVGDDVDLGDRTLRIAAILRQEPDRGGTLISFAPRLLVRIEELDEAGLTGPGSRITERLLIGGESAAIASFEAWLKPRIEGRAAIQNLADSQQTLARALDRALSFLRLAVLCAVLLSGVALLLSARRYAELEQSAVALLKTLGWTGRQLLVRYTLAMLLLGLLAGLAGALVAVGSEQLLVHLLDIEELRAAPTPSLWQAWIGPVLAFGLLLACVLPSVIALARVPPIAVLKQETRALPQRRLTTLLPPTLLLFALAWLATADARLAGFALGGLVFMLLVVAGIAWAMLRLLPRTARGSWRLGLNKYRHAPLLGMVQISALAAGFAALALIGVLSRDLLDTWKLSLSDDTPNYFLINAREEQRESLLAALASRGAQRLTHAPVAVARLKSINQTPVAELGGENLTARDRLQRNQNLSWAGEPGIGNRIVAGQWFRDDGMAEISVATSWANPLGVKPGDRLTLTVGEREVVATVTSLRDVSWDSFAVNFFLVLEPSAAQGLAHSHIFSFHLDPARRPELDQVLRDNGNLSLMDVEALLAEVRRLIDRASLAVKLVFAFSVLAGLLVLLAAFSVTLDERLKEAAILRVLGARARQLRAAVLAEFGAIGLAAGLLASGIALAVGSLLAQRIFDLPLKADWWALASVVLGAVVLACGLGALAAERLLRSRALEALKRV